jgi:DMSO/TMAO reductase YedYZ molybdopterin-dependent catalytic subunit
MQEQQVVRPGLIAGAIAAVVMEIAQLIARVGAGVPLFPDLLEDFATRLIPAPIFARVLDTLQFQAKPLLYVGIFVVQIVAGALLGALFASIWGRRLDPGRARWDGWGGALLTAAVAWLLTGLVILPIAGRGVFGAYVAAGALALNLSLVTSFFLYGITLAGTYRILLVARGLEGTAPAAASDAESVRNAERRRLLGGVAVGAVAVLASTAAYRSLGTSPSLGGSEADSPLAPALPTPGGVATAETAAAPAGAAVATTAPAPVVTSASTVSATSAAAASTAASATFPVITGQPAPVVVTVPPSTPPSLPKPVTPPEWTIKGLFPEVTATTDFYQVSKNFFSDPVVDASGWTLQVTGLVKQGYTLTYNKLLAMPIIERYQTLTCISNEVGGNLISNASWRGVPLRDLLALAQPDPSAKKVVFTAADGYQDSITFDRAMLPTNVLAHTMNGEPLVAGHGMPVRLLIPGIYGMKNVKWLTKIELVAEDFQGYWQMRGWSDSAFIKTSSQIDAPNDGATLKAGKQELAGVAFGGDKGISKVEVSLDGGKSWNDAILKEALGAFTWRLWRYDWDAKPGTYVAVVRATNGVGEVQTATVADTLPDGSSGWHHITVQVS